MTSRSPVNRFAQQVRDYLVVADGPACLRGEVGGDGSEPGPDRGGYDDAHRVRSAITSRAGFQKWSNT